MKKQLQKTRQFYKGRETTHRLGLIFYHRQCMKNRTPATENNIKVYDYSPYNVCFMVMTKCKHALCIASKGFRP